ncbi:MAG: hypothetical protein ABIP93_02975 [Gemmatimonadaceae bacterium]
MTELPIPALGAPRSSAPTPPDAEHSRNARLRRADWRYLLPDAAPARALCLAGAALRESCGVVASRVDDVPHAGVAYDLVVAENPDESSLRALAAAMRPDGACYTEWTRTGLDAPRRLRRALQRAGFRAPRVYHAWPSAARCEVWLPTEGAAAAHYWRNAARSTRVRAEKLRTGVGATLARVGLHERLGIVAVGPSAPTAPQLVCLARERSAPGDDWLLVTLGERVVGKVVMLTFDDAGAPGVAIKTARAPESVRGVEREADVLDEVHARHPMDLHGVPRVAFRALVNGAPVVGLSALTGIPLAALLTARSYGQIAEQVTDWLLAFAEPAAALAGTSSWDRVIGPAFERFSSDFGAVVGVERLERTRRALRALGPLPVVCEQRDFSPWNVFDGAAGLVVLDWESGEPNGLPALDLAYFFTHAVYYLEGAWTSGRFEEAYRIAWSPSSRVGRLNHACARRYLARLGLGPELLPPLRLFAWVLHAHSDYLQLRADAGAPPSDALLRSSRFLRLFDVELEGVTA